MMEAKDIIKEAVRLGACAASDGVTDWKSLCWLFFTPQGREFCEDNNFPTIRMFRAVKYSVMTHGVFVDAGDLTSKNRKDIGLIGKTEATLIYDDNTKVHKIILMHGAKAYIKASNYVVLLIVNVGNCEVIIDKDETVSVLS